MKYTFCFDINSNSAPAIIARRIKKHSSVLEFGTADGVLTKYLNDELGCNIYGVEIEEEFAKAASKYTEMMYIGDIEKYDWLNFYKGFKFDHIIFSDVLEHLYNPEQALKEATNLLKENGTILVSIPNVAHSSIILSLLHDKFEYRETGLLDKTHLRFFTKHSIEEMFEKLSLSIAYSSGVYIPPALTEFDYTYKDVPKCVSDYFKESKYRDVYQYVYEVEKEVVDNPIVEFNPKAFVTINILDDNGQKIYEAFDDKCDSVTPFEFKLNLNESIIARSIHILIRNIPDVNNVEFLKVNESFYSDYNTNIEEYCGDLHVNENGITIYLPFFDDVDIHTIGFRLTNEVVVNNGMCEKKTFLQRILSKFFNS